MYTGLINTFREYLPVTDKTPVVTLNEGNTPLIKADNLAKKIGVEAEIYLKFEGCNPTGSFKDRGTNGAACNALKDVSKEIDVACEATHCRFNENEKCHADHIGISGAGACTCGETECASFECNCKYE